LIGKPAQEERGEQEWNAFPGNIRVSSTFQCSSIPAAKRQATITCFARRVNTCTP
jgi:hypothetical protein